jgi:hypothetical protein
VIQQGTVLEYDRSTGSGRHADREQIDWSAIARGDCSSGGDIVGRCGITGQLVRRGVSTARHDDARSWGMLVLAYITAL